MNHDSGRRYNGSMRRGNPPRGANRCDASIRSMIAKTAVVALVALAGCGDARHPDAEADSSARAKPDQWIDRHGNVCESLEPGLARCRTPGGHLWYREDVPTPGSLVRDPVKGMMWIFSRGRGDAVRGSGPNANDAGPGTGD